MKKRSLATFEPKNIARSAAYGAAICALAAVLSSGAMKCPVATLTHRPCPGCGSTRAVLALLHLDVAGAFRFNPVAPIVAVCIGVLVAEGLWSVARDGHARELGLRGASRYALYGLLVAIVLQIPIWALRFFGLFGGPVPV